jgi:hypothetical protein
LGLVRGEKKQFSGTVVATISRVEVRNEHTGI